MNPQLTNHDLMILFRSLQAIINMNLTGSALANDGEIADACGHIAHRFENQGKYEDDTKTKD